MNLRSAATAFTCSHLSLTSDIFAETAPAASASQVPNCVYRKSQRPEWNCVQGRAKIAQNPRLQSRFKFANPMPHPLKRKRGEAKNLFVPP